MGHILWLWRDEWLTLAALACSWPIFRFGFRRRFWRLWIPGALLGLAIETMTEPEWTYFIKIYVWRDVSPFVIAGWGILLCWLVVLSDGLYRRWFSRDPYIPGEKAYGLFLTDLLIGLPLLLGNELLGLHILKVWKYNAILRWNHILPVIHYPLEGLAAIAFLVLAVPAAVRYWEGGHDLQK